MALVSITIQRLTQYYNMHIIIKFKEEKNFEECKNIKYLFINKRNGKNNIHQT